MSPNKWRFALVAVLLVPAHAFAGDEKDQQAYCAYVIEQAQAQRDLLRTPTGVVGMTQPETGLPLQVVGGATLGLADLRKAGLTMEVARKNCELYSAATSAQQQIQYALASLDREALSNRLKLIEQGSNSLVDLMKQTSKMVEAQNATRLMLFSLQTTKIKLNADRADTQAKLTAIYTPTLTDLPLKELVARKENSEARAQTALDNLSRQDNWNVALTVGVHQQVNPVAQGAQPYGMVSVSYNLASRAINKHLDRAVEAHDEWKKLQEGEVVRGMETLRQQLVDTVAVQEARLQSLREESQQLDQNLRLVATPDTSTAFDFRNQLLAAQLLLQIETADATFRIERLREYLARNY
jgi:hypothetical protein